MTILVTLQQEVEYDEEEFLTAISDWPRDGLSVIPRQIDISSSKEKPISMESIQAKDLRVGDMMYEIVDPSNGYPSYDGKIVNITRTE